MKPGQPVQPVEPTGQGEPCGGFSGTDCDEAWAAATGDPVRREGRTAAAVRPGAGHR